jgi:transposase
MLSLTLPNPERILLEHFIFGSPSGKATCRAQALLWLSDGASLDEVADRLGIHRSTVYRWASRFQERDDWPLDVRLADGPRLGRPPMALGVIDPLIDAVIEEDPQSFGYRYTCWTADLLRDYLQEFHGIVVCRKSVSLAIARLGLRWKRPRHRLAQRPDTWRQAKGGLKKGSSRVSGRSC